MELTQEQRAAADEILSDWTGMKSLSGAAGTGKSTLLTVIAAELMSRRLVLWTAMTGKAALRLRELFGGDREVTTFHKAFFFSPYEKPPKEKKCKCGHDRDDHQLVSNDGSCDQDGCDCTRFKQLTVSVREKRDRNEIEFTEDKIRPPPPPGSLMIIDESSMMTPSLFNMLPRWAGVSFLFVGDSFQLPPVLSKKEVQEGFSEDWSVFGVVPGPTLNTVLRSTDDILHVATLLRVERRLLRESRGDYSYLRLPVSNLAINEYINSKGALGLITWRNDLRMRLNKRIRRKLGRTEELPEVGEIVVPTKNSAGQDREQAEIALKAERVEDEPEIIASVMNGEIIRLKTRRKGPKLGSVETWWVETDDGRTFLARADGDKEIMDGVPKYLADKKDWWAHQSAKKLTKLDPVPITWGYCITAHKAQGSEYDSVLVVLTPSDTTNPYFQKKSVLPSGESVPFWTRWIYTALTRARKKVALCIGPEV